MSSELQKVEEYMLHNSNVTCTTKHTFSEGVYVREITMPGGSFILGAIHNTKHLNIISKGACILIDPDTGELTDIVAPCTFESDVGVQKLLYIVEECVWSTIHITEETDITKLEEELVTVSDTYKKIVGKDKYREGDSFNELHSSRNRNSIKCSRV